MRCCGGALRTGAWGTATAAPAPAPKMFRGRWARLAAMQPQAPTSPGSTRPVPRRHAWSSGSAAEAALPQHELPGQLQGWAWVKAKGVQTVLNTRRLSSPSPAFAALRHTRCTVQRHQQAAGPRLPLALFLGRALRVLQRDCLSAAARPSVAVPCAGAHAPSVPSHSKHLLRVCCFRVIVFQVCVDTDTDWRSASSSVVSFNRRRVHHGPRPARPERANCSSCAAPQPVHCHHLQGCGRQ
jgi:hypothetical protein